MEHLRTTHNPQNESEIGFVTGIKNYLITLEGIPGAHAEDLLVSEEGARALVVSLEDEKVKAMLLDTASVKPGDKFVLKRGEKVFSFGDHLLGKVIDALGNPLDPDTSFPPPEKEISVEVEAVGLGKRETIREQLFTGITMVDVLLPIAKGQRQLIYGPLHSGKTIFLQDVIVNQQFQDVVCIYAAIGKPASLLESLISFLHNDTGNPNTIILAALSDEPTQKIIIAPSVAMSIAEHFSSQGKDVLLIFDDLAIHAKYLREAGLLSERLPARESYPADIFYQHAHIIERAGKFSKDAGGGSITLLVTLETEIESYSDYIPTNLMATTDGHLLFSPARYAQGIYPPLSEEQSVTRVGKNSQKLVQKQLATKVLALLAQYQQQKEYSQFAIVVNEDTKKLLHQGELIYFLLRQNPLENLPAFTQIVLLALTFLPFLLDRDKQFIERNKHAIIDFLKQEDALLELKKSFDEDMPADDFIKRLGSDISLFEKICQQ